MTFRSRELCLRILIFVLVFVLCQKTGNFLIILLIFFSKFHKKLTRSYIKNLGHSSLKSNVLSTYVKFQG